MVAIALRCVLLLTIGEGQRTLEDSTIANCTNKGEGREDHDKVNYLLGLVVGISSPMSVLPSGPIPYPTTHISYRTHTYVPLIIVYICMYIACQIPIIYAYVRYVSYRDMKLPMEMVKHSISYMKWADVLYIRKTQDQSSTVKEVIWWKKKNHQHLLPAGPKRVSYRCLLGRFVDFKDRFHGISMGISGNPQASLFSFIPNINLWIKANMVQGKVLVVQL